MSILARRNNVAVRFSDFSGGVNYSEDSTRIRKNQVQYSKNAILRKNGAIRRPGTLAKTAFDLTTYIKGLHVFLDLSDNERLLIGCDGELSKLAVADGEDTLLYDLTGTGNFYFADALGKCWITNGTKVVKVEGDTAYQVGIAAPTGVTATAAAGGTLPDGDYIVYASYARTVASTNVLYSAGQLVGTVTLSGGNNTILVDDFTDSLDPQVNNKVIWMSDADLSTIYFYYDTDDNTTDTFSVASDAEKAESILFSTSAANNSAVPAFTHIHAADGRIWGSLSNRLHYSLRNTSNAYDLERFFPLNYIDFPHKITGIFSVGQNLYVNTPAGIYVQPNSDVTARSIWLEKRWRFYNMNSVVDYSGGKLGLTNDGVKFFDGEKFYDYDISEDIKSEISKMYNTTSVFEPFGMILRRGIRTEYHLTYCDDSVHSITNNRRAVLNLDKLSYLPDKSTIAPWEIWTNSATHMASSQAGTVYQAQSHLTAPVLYVENTNTSVDEGLYLDDSTIGTATSYAEIRVKTRTELLDISARINWHTIRTMSRLSAETLIQVNMRDVEGLLSSDDIGVGTGPSLWDVFLWDVGVWASSSPKLRKSGLPMNLHGYMMYVEFSQTGSDPDFNILDIVVEGIASRTRFT